MKKKNLILTIWGSFRKEQIKSRFFVTNSALKRRNLKYLQYLFYNTISNYSNVKYIFIPPPLCHGIFMNENTIIYWKYEYGA